MTIKSFFSFNKNKTFWINIVLMVVAVAAGILAIFKGLDIYTLHGKSIEVPSIEGKSLEEATNILKHYHLNGVVSDSTYVKDKRPSSILDYNPPAKARVKKGRTIYLTINTKNIPLYPIPEVADNSSLRQAIARIVASGFKLTEHEYVSGEKDWVYGIKYQGKELPLKAEAPIGSTLTLIVGDGGALEADSLRAVQDSLMQLRKENDSAKNEGVDNSWF